MDDINLSESHSDSEDEMSSSSSSNEATSNLQTVGDVSTDDQVANRPSASQQETHPAIAQVILAR